MDDEFFELDRTFHGLTLGDVNSEITLGRRIGRSFSCAELLAEHRVVVLTEAGSGKTEEFRNAAKTARAESKAANLHDVRCRRSRCALVHRGDHKKARWQTPPAMALVDFVGLVEAFEAHWASLAPRYPDMDGIRIIGIDLTPRDGKPKRTLKLDEGCP